MSSDTCTYTVPEISCDHCKRAIGRHSSLLDGAATATVDIDAKTVTLTGGDPNSIETAIVDAGYSVSEASGVQTMAAEFCHPGLIEIGWLLDATSLQTSVCGLTYAEAAAETGTNPKRFAKRLHTARTTVRKAVT